MFNIIGGNPFMSSYIGSYAPNYSADGVFNPGQNYSLPPYMMGVGMPSSQPQVPFGIPTQGIPLSPQGILRDGLQVTPFGFSNVGTNVLPEFNGFSSLANIGITGMPNQISPQLPISGGLGAQPQGTSQSLFPLLMQMLQQITQRNNPSVPLPIPGTTPMQLPPLPSDSNTTNNTSTPSTTNPADAVLTSFGLDPASFANDSMKMAKLSQLKPAMDYLLGTILGVNTSGIPTVVEEAQVLRQKDAELNQLLTTLGLGQTVNFSYYDKYNELMNLNTQLQYFLKRRSSLPGALSPNILDRYNAATQAGFVKL